VAIAAQFLSESTTPSRQLPRPGQPKAASLQTLLSLLELAEPLVKCRGKYAEIVTFRYFLAEALVRIRKLALRVLLESQKSEPVGRLEPA